MPDDHVKFEELRPGVNSIVEIAGGDAWMEIADEVLRKFMNNGALMANACCCSSSIVSSCTCCASCCCCSIASSCSTGVSSFDIRSLRSSWDVLRTDHVLTRHTRLRSLVK